MSIAKLKLLEIEFPSSQYDALLLKLINLDDFHPEPASKFADSVQGLSVLNRENPYAGLIDRIEEIRDKYHLDIQKQDVDNVRINIIQADSEFCNMIEDVKKYENIKNELEAMIKENDAAITQLEHMINADIDFDSMLNCKYLKVRFGRIPTSNLEKVDYYSQYPFLFKILHKGKKETYCGYLVTLDKAPEIDNIFSSLYFEQIEIPEFVHGKPDDALQVLKEENDTAKNYMKVLDERTQELFNKNLPRLNEVYSISKKLTKTYDAQKYVVVFGDTAAVYGFCEDKKASVIKADFEQIDGVHVEIKPANGDSRLTPPTKLKSNWFSEPFSMFVEMYGVPSYTDFDPTTLVAITYTFLFGMMYGDIGQGIVLAIVGYIAYKWKGMKLGAIGMRLAIACVIFGCVFGSIFGSEDLFQLFATPLLLPLESSNTMTLLMIAVGTGVALILIAMGFNIYLNIKKKNMGEALFSQNGVAGLIFYVSVLLVVLDMMMGIDLKFIGVPFYIICIVVPVLLMFLKEALEHKLEDEPMFPEGIGGYFATSFFELFDIVLTFISNTMSFLRVGGFILSHAGMMLVVYTLAEMVGGGSINIGYLLVVILGNAFVMVLEGLVVGIQVLRLEFYEMFSRYYEGKGIPFVSIKDR